MRRISLFPILHQRVANPADIFEKTFSDIFNGNFPVGVRPNGFAQVPAANISETDDEFRIELAAPGLTKQDFEVSLENEMLTIVAKKEAKAEENGKYTRREFSFLEFKRSFLLPDAVNPAAISANYENGILVLTLPKKEEAKPQPARTIEIA